MVLWVKEGSEAPSSRATQTRVVWHECYGMACPPASTVYRLVRMAENVCSPS